MSKVEAIGLAIPFLGCWIIIGIYAFRWLAGYRD